MSIHGIKCRYILDYVW